MFLLQMSGVPGAGKTTLALKIAKETGAVILDHDVLKTSLISAGVDHSVAGKAAYEAAYCLAESSLSLGHNVILDSPCFHEIQVIRGLSIAEKHHAQYKYIECYIEDIDEIDRRLKQRTRLPSQLSSVCERTPEMFLNWARNMKKPPEGFLVLYTDKPFDEYYQTALDYLQVNS